VNKKTPFYHLHEKHHAKFVSFASYLMPIQYKGVSLEHNHVRNHVGVFDVSHMAQIYIKGENSFDLVQRITTNDVAKLYPGKIQYSCMLNKAGGIIDDLLVYCINSNFYMLVVNAANAEKDFTWICSNNIDEVEIVNVTQNHGLLAVQGPDSYNLLQKLTSIDLGSIPYYSFKIDVFGDCEDVIISNTGYTGATGFELYMKKDVAEKIWLKLFEHSDNLQPIGLAARDTLRLEMGYCLYGNDINETTSPLEAGLSWIVKNSTDFIGKDAILYQLSKGIKRLLVGFVLCERGIPRSGYDIFDDHDNLIGQVTSGTMSPFLQKSIGMGYVNKEESTLGNHIFIVIRNKKVKAKIVKLPFYEK